MTSICLTIHNKEYLLNELLLRLYKYTTGVYEVIFCLDACTDDSEVVLTEFIKMFTRFGIKTTTIYANDVYETRANNLCAKKASGDHVIFVQDDVLINELNWNERLLTPFKVYNDIFAVSGNCAHNWEINANSIDAKSEQVNSTRWCDLINHVDHANRHTIDRNTFGVRDSVNRAPLAVNHADLASLGYFDELYSPQDMDDHDLCFRMREKMGKRVGCYWIDYTANPEWGGTRDANGETKPWVFKTNNKNVRLFLSRHRDAINRKTIENIKIF